MTLAVSSKRFVPSASTSGSSGWLPRPSVSAGKAMHRLDHRLVLRGALLGGERVVSCSAVFGGVLGALGGRAVAADRQRGGHARTRRGPGSCSRSRRCPARAR